MDHLLLYLPNVIAACVCSVALSLIGAQLATRSQTLHVMVLSQASNLGLLVAWALVTALGFLPDDFSQIVKTISFCFAALVYLLAIGMAERNRHKSTQVLLTFFVFCLSMGYLLTSAFPELDSHFVSGFLGDLATASLGDCLWIGFWAVLAVFFLGFKWRDVTLQSVWSVLGIYNKHSLLRLGFLVLTFLLVAESTRIFGFLFTISSLVVLPFLATPAAAGLWSYFRVLMGTALLSTALGFCLSLSAQVLSTSATVVVAQVFIGLTVANVLAFKFRRKKLA